MDAENKRVGLEAFEQIKRAIVVAAHPDDMETMMGGTIWQLTQRGVRFDQLICTRGDLGTRNPDMPPDELARTRLEEARSAARILGVSEVDVLNYHDGELEPNLDLRAEVARYYRKWQPDTVFTFDPYSPAQIHPDHRAAGRAALDAFMPSKMPLYRPEQLRDSKPANIQRIFLFNPERPLVFIDVTDAYEKKLDSSLAHVSQFPEGEKSLDWMRRIDSLAAERAGAAGRLMEAFGQITVW